MPRICHCHYQPNLNSVPVLILFHKFSSLSPSPQHLCLCSLFHLNFGFHLDLPKPNLPKPNSVPVLILFHKFSSLSPSPQHLCLCSLLHLNFGFHLDLFTCLNPTCLNPTLSLNFRLGSDFLHKASV